MENQYFTRKISEGSVKSTHTCSFDSSIVLTKLVQRGKKVLESVIVSSANQGENDSKKNQAAIKGELMNRISAIRINGLCVVYEELGESFDDDEIIEVIAFINGADMSKFGGKKQTEEEKKEEDLKNA